MENLGTMPLVKSKIDHSIWPIDTSSLYQHHLWKSQDIEINIRQFNTSVCTTQRKGLCLSLHMCTMIQQPCFNINALNNLHILFINRKWIGLFFRPLQTWIYRLYKCRDGVIYGKCEYLCTTWSGHWHIQQAIFSLLLELSNI